MLSISKLEKLMAVHGYYIISYFIMDRTCVWCEVTSNNTSFLLYIPSKYSIAPPKGSNIDNVYTIKIIDPGDDESLENTAENYAGNPDEYSLENMYDGKAQLSPAVSRGDIGNHLEERYKREIKLLDMSENDSKSLKDSVRQLKRLRYSVQNVKYKVATMFGRYICAVKRDDSIECYSIGGYLPSNGGLNRLFVTVDLELMYSKMDSMSLNISTIEKGIYHVLDKNHGTHTHTIKKLLDDRKDVLRHSERAKTRKKNYDIYIADSTEMLSSIIDSETTSRKAIENFDSVKRGSKDGKGNVLHGDISRTRGRAKLTAELEEILKVKSDLHATLQEIKSKRVNSMLRVDQIMFDNAVMVECVLRNFNDLIKFS
jgi:hypothetical protein